MRRVGLVVAFIVGAYLVVRAAADPFLRDFSDPSTYESDWGGPSLAGVLVVHMGPGLVAAALMVRWFRRRRRRLPTAPQRDGSQKEAKELPVRR